MIIKIIILAMLLAFSTFSTFINQNGVINFDQTIIKSVCEIIRDFDLTKSKRFIQNEVELCSEQSEIDYFFKSDYG